MTLEKIVQVSLPHFSDTLHRGVPKYARFYNAIKDAVHAGVLIPGDKLPSEQALSSRLPASLGTLQKALKALSDDGIVVREHGRGTFIRDPEVKFEDIRVFRFMDQGRPLDLTLQGLGIFEVTPAPSIARFLGNATHCALIKRRLQVEGEPWTYNELFMPLAYADALMNKPPGEFDGLSLHEYLFQQKRILTSRFEHQMGVHDFSRDARAALELDDKVHQGMLWRVRGYTQKGQPTTYQRFEIQPDHRDIELSSHAVQDHRI
ncbi:MULTISPECIES: GntR family transcriptional regulator [unclassified Halomonas]|uniref:GntR family transcriptional regulator n=1 Tax=unclassified Halomonas TaxID=2609666 RepID=UPI0020769661|nr:MULTISPECIES: GntR family transcriptional regulator [unclassified Halomonas]